MTTSDPYEAPRARVDPPPSERQRSRPRLASTGQRFLNLVIDTVVVQVLAFLVGVLIVAVLIAAGSDESVTTDSSTELLLQFVGIGVWLLYYIAFESLLGWTVGKLITGTRVVDLEGAKPSFGRVVGRSLCRMIPFDAFSFLGRSPGWHDTIPKTRVVRVR